MALVRIVLLFPLEVLGVPDSLASWINNRTYAELRRRFGDIEFSERIMAILQESDEQED